MKHDFTKLRQVRESMGMTQEKLAILSNVSERTVQRAEAGATMRLDTLSDFAAVLEIPLSELALDQDNGGTDRDVSLRLARGGRPVIDDLAKSGVARFDCEMDPEADEIEPLLELVALIEQRLPTPWDTDQHPAEVALSEKVRVAARLRDLIVILAGKGIGLYSSTCWVSARYPRYDVDEGHRYTTTDQRYEKVMALQMTICRSDDDRIYRKSVASWGLELAPSSAFDTDLDDVPF